MEPHKEFLMVSFKTKPHPGTVAQWQSTCYRTRRCKFDSYWFHKLNNKDYEKNYSYSFEKNYDICKGNINKENQVLEIGHMIEFFKKHLK